MAPALRETLLLVCGVLLGIVAGAAIILFLNLEPGTQAQEQPTRSEAQARPAEPIPPATAQMGAGPAPSSTAAPATAPVAAAAPVACPVRPLLATAGPKDGQLLPPADVAGKGADEAERLLLTGKEAAAAGQLRDAEVAWLTSCRIADARKGAGSVEAATARYQLARHYASRASAEGNVPVAEREALRRRAQAYYENSLQTFQATLGTSHEKTRFASEGLAALQQPAPPKATSVAAPAAPAAPVARDTASASPPATSSPPTAASPQAARAAPARDTAAAAAAPPSAPAARSPAPRPTPREAAAPAEVVEPRVRQATGDPGVSTAPVSADPIARPSFDCARARSTPEKIICGDAELSRLDRELGRLHARAKNAAPDAAAFKRQNDQEWRRREATCRDRVCLVGWYAERRRQLQESLGGATDTAAR